MARLGGSWQRITDASIYRTRPYRPRKRRDTSKLTAAERGRRAGTFVGHYKTDRSPKTTLVHPERDKPVYGIVLNMSAETRAKLMATPEGRKALVVE